MMAITSYTATRFRDRVTVTVTSDLSGTIYYHWYVDGAYTGRTEIPSKSFYLPSGDQARIVCNDTTDDDYDAIANAPEDWPARRTLYWTRPDDSDVDKYMVEQQKDGGAWSVLGYVTDDGSWSYSYLTPRLDDLSDYTWRITPIDTAGNEGTAITIGAERIVRRPDAPDFNVTFNAGALTVTFSEAS